MIFHLFMMFYIPLIFYFLIPNMFILLWFTLLKKICEAFSLKTDVMILTSHLVCNF